MNVKEKVKMVKIKSGIFKIDSIAKGELQQLGNFWYFGCPRCGEVLKLSHKSILSGEGITLSPSIGCPICQLHIFIKDSIVEYLSDLIKK